MALPDMTLACLACWGQGPAKNRPNGRGETVMFRSLPHSSCALLRALRI